MRPINHKCQIRVTRNLFFLVIGLVKIRNVAVLHDTLQHCKSNREDFSLVTMMALKYDRNIDKLNIFTFAHNLIIYQ